MYISQKLKWLEPYVNDVKKMHKKFNKLKKITIMRSSFTKRDRAYGEFRELVDNTQKIALRIEYQYIDFYPLKVTLKPFSKVDILQNLAHELAHCYHFEHTPEHKILESEITTYFMYKLKTTGYISEEIELGE